MDWLTFISKLIDAAAWPLAAIIGLLLLRKPLFELIPQMRKLKYKDFEAEFAQDVQQLKQEVIQELPERPPLVPEHEKEEKRLYELAEIAPNAAVMEVWKHVETAAKNLISSRGHDLAYDISTPYRLIERVLDRGGLIEKRKVKIFDELRRLRNKVAHAGEFEVSPTQAAEYVRLAILLVEYLDSETKKATEELANKP